MGQVDCCVKRTNKVQIVHLPACQAMEYIPDSPVFGGARKQSCVSEGVQKETVHVEDTDCRTRGGSPRKCTPETFGSVGAGRSFAIHVAVLAWHQRRQCRLADDGTGVQ